MSLVRVVCDVHCCVCVVCLVCGLRTRSASEEWTPLPCIDSGRPWARRCTCQPPASGLRSLSRWARRMEGQDGSSAPSFTDWSVPFKFSAVADPFPPLINFGFILHVFNFANFIPSSPPSVASPVKIYSSSVLCCPTSYCRS